MAKLNFQDQTPTNRIPHPFGIGRRQWFLLTTRPGFRKIWFSRHLDQEKIITVLLGLAVRAFRAGFSGREVVSVLKAWAKGRHVEVAGSQISDALTMAFPLTRSYVNEYQDQQAEKDANKKIRLAATAVIAYLHHHPKSSPSDLARDLQVELSASKKMLSRLWKEKVIQKTGHGWYSNIEPDSWQSSPSALAAELEAVSQLIDQQIRYLHVSRENYTGSRADGVRRAQSECLINLFSHLGHVDDYVKNIADIRMTCASCGLHLAAEVERHLAISAVADRIPDPDPDEWAEYEFIPGWRWDTAIEHLKRREQMASFFSQFSACSRASYPSASKPADADDDAPIGH